MAGEMWPSNRLKSTFANSNIEFSSLVGWWTQFTLSLFQVDKEDEEKRGEKSSFCDFSSPSFFPALFSVNACILLMLFLVGPLME